MAGAVLIVPTTTSYELKDQLKKKKLKDKGAKGQTRLIGVPQNKKQAVASGAKPKASSLAAANSTMGSNHPHNYLVRGGRRSIEKENEELLDKLNKAAVKDLRAANNTLANELLRLRQAYEEEKDTLRNELGRLSSEFQTAHERATREAKLREELEAHTHSRMRELQKRLRDENILRTSAQAELVALRQQQEGSARSEPQTHHSQMQGGSTTDELRGRLASLEARLEAELSSKNDAILHASSLSAQLLSANERAEALNKAAQDAHGSTTLHKDLVNQLQRDLAAAQLAASHSAAEAAELRAQLSLQPTSSAGTGMAELERLHLELDRLRMRLTQAEGDCQQLRGEASSERLRAAEIESRSRKQSALVESLQDEVAVLRQERDGRHVALEREYAAREERVRAEATAEAAMMLGDLEAKDAALREASMRLRALEQSRYRVDSTELQQLRSAQERAAQLSKENAELQDALARAQETGSRDAGRRDTALAELQESLRTANSRLAVAQSTAAAEKLKFEELIAAMEPRLAKAESEVVTLRAELSAAHASKEGMWSESRHRDAETHRLQDRLQDEITAGQRLKAELATLQAAHLKELEVKGRMINDMLAAVRAEERTKLEAQQDARALRQRVDCYEAELANSKAANMQLAEAARQAEEARDVAERTARSLQRKAKHYKKENKALLSNYDTWINSLVKQSRFDSSSAHIPPSALPTSTASGGLAADLAAAQRSRLLESPSDSEEDMSSLGQFLRGTSRNTQRPSTGFTRRSTSDDDETDIGYEQEGRLEQMSRLLDRKGRHRV